MRFRELRRPIDRKITIGTPSGNVSAKLRDVSATGMKIAGTSLPLDTMVLIPILGKDLEARVVYSNDTEIGIRFTRALSKEQVTAIVSPGGVSGFGQIQRFREM